MEKSIMIGIQILDALDEADFAALDKLFSVDADINKITENDKWSWLHKALLGFDPQKPPRESIEYLIRHGLDVNAQDRYGMTPLNYAMRSKNVAAATALLEAGADPNIPNIDRVTPLAYINGMPEQLSLLKLMLDKGGDVNFHNGDHGILEGVKKYSGDDPAFKEVIALMEQYDKTAKNNSPNYKNEP
ncbi:ankyrin repeat domain-containing protein [Cardiobacterium valvarum]|uniref:Ribulose-5-phosphate 4-epimerase and related epimerases and aldolases n=1 Tax=Cardiobacterium valvarum TaxID=194702 RepID=A0A381ECV6_9GAMM|nr:ankyrin repeat domain-containing protein [Cardiobacterium valvarum]SUX24816.1 Ribulose-5-phosphate 4-epimerase and related epimerases and aldolases [Cardiobacterium valvarum]